MAESNLRNARYHVDAERDEQKDGKEPGASELIAVYGWMAKYEQSCGSTADVEKRASESGWEGSQQARHGASSVQTAVCKAVMEVNEAERGDHIIKKTCSTLFISSHSNIDGQRLPRKGRA